MEVPEAAAAGTSALRWPRLVAGGTLGPCLSWSVGGPIAAGKSATAAARRPPHRMDSCSLTHISFLPSPGVLCIVNLPSNVIDC